MTTRPLSDLEREIFTAIAVRQLCETLVGAGVTLDVGGRLAVKIMAAELVSQYEAGAPKPDFAAEAMRIKNKLH